MLSSRGYLWVLMSLLAGAAARVQAQNASDPADTTPGPSSQVTTTSPTVDSKEQTAEHDSVTSKTDKPLSFAVSVTQNFGAKRDVDTLTGIEFSAVYQQNKQLKWSATQRLTKLYFVEPDEKEVQASDTSLGLSYQLLGGARKGDDSPKTRVSLGTGLTLPVSTYSSEQKLTTVASVSASVTQSLGIVTALVRPFFRYHVNQYKTLLKDDSGATVVRYRMGILAEVSAELPYNLGLSLSSQWVERAYENPPYGSHPPEHDYLFDATLSYAWNDQTDFAVGYSQGNRAEQLGSVDVYLFDEEATQYFISASRKF